jgi:hypothetical protein
LEEIWESSKAGNRTLYQRDSSLAFSISHCELRSIISIACVIGAIHIQPFCSFSFKRRKPALHSLIARWAIEPVDITNGIRNIEFGRIYIAHLFWRKLYSDL